MLSIVFCVVEVVNFDSAERSPRFSRHLVRYLIIAITPRRRYRLSASCTKGICFCYAVLEKLPSKLDLDFSLRSD